MPDAVRIVKGRDVFYAQFVIDVRPYGMTKEKVFEENKRIIQDNSEAIHRAIEAGKPTNRLRLKHLVPGIVEHPKTSALVELMRTAGLYKQFCVSMDLGPKNIAVVLQSERHLIAVLQPIFDKLVEYAGQVRILRKGREIAEYMRKDPALITRHIKEREMKKDTVRVIATLKERKANVNSQV